MAEAAVDGPRNSTRSSWRRDRHRLQVVLLQEAFRHCTTLAAPGDGVTVLKAARIPTKGPGVSVADDLGKALTANLAAALGLHRAWDRATSVMASAVPPAR